MKKIFAAVVMAIVTVLGANKVNAENSMELNPMMFEYGYKMPDTTEDQAQKSVVLADNGNLTSGDVPGRGLRRTGMIMTGAGFTVAAAFGIYAANIANDEPEDGGKLVGDIFGVVMATGAAAIGAAAGIVGIVLWTKGQHRMNNFKASSNGVGLAYTF